MAALERMEETDIVEVLIKREKCEESTSEEYFQASVCDVTVKQETPEGEILYYHGENSHVKQEDSPMIFDDAHDLMMVLIKQENFEENTTELFQNGITPYICYHCDLEWDKFNDLRRHIKSKHTRKLFKCQCPHCSFRGTKLAHLKSHIFEEHADERLLFCFHCNYQTCIPYCLKRHFSKRHVKAKHITPYICYHCDLEWDKFNDLRRHIKSKHTRKLFKCQCPHCSFRGTKLAHLKSHIFEEHADERLLFCFHCNYQTCIPYCLKRHFSKRHVKAKHYPKSNNSNKKTTTFKDDLEISLDALKKHHCSHCSFKSKTITDLTRHISATHYGEKPHHCQYCNYRSARVNTLNRHIIAVHNGEKTHQCPHCGYKAMRMSYLREHIRAIHVGEKPYQCFYCSYKCGWSGKIKKHIAMRHGNKDPSLKNPLKAKKRQKCPHCDYEPGQNVDLNKHILAVHTNNKPFHCPYCSFRAGWARSVKRHISIIHKKAESH